MGKIILLDEHTANKIAAGEVVERPASVVKELVENAIDAGSSRIEVSIIDGGLTEIVVSDNGSGMDTVDARLAFERHATSKIRYAGDLERIQTLGFRGEALPSIAAVSRVSLKTRTRESVSGTELVIEGGKILNVDEAGCPAGTIVKVNRLFYNMPARKKHLKGPTTEAGHISELLNRFAMGYPYVSFQLKSNGLVVLKTSGNGSLLECIHNIYGAGTAREMLAVEAEKGDFSIFGYIGKPSVTRAARNHQILFVNGRYVRSRLISECIEKAYHTMLMTGRHPVFIINVNTRAEDVDVNVHPAKQEVRFADVRALQDFITERVAAVLTGNRLIPAVEAPARKTYAGDLRQEEWKSARVFEKPQQDLYNANAFGLPGQPDGVSSTPDGISGATEPVSPDQQGARADFPDIRPIGQIDCTYIVAQGADGLYLIDQHAAHERVLYESYMNRSDRAAASEILLFPETLELTHQEAQLLNDNIDTITDLGFLVEHFGGDSFLLRGVPAGVSNALGKEIFLDLLDYFSQNRYKITGKALREHLIITMACKNAIKANHKLGLPEMESLLARLADTTCPYTCPHGRPTMVHFSGYELEKRFKRVL